MDKYTKPDMTVFSIEYHPICNQSFTESNGTWTSASDGQPGFFDNPDQGYNTGF